jgi:hypothetical protein
MVAHLEKLVTLGKTMDKQVKSFRLDAPTREAIRIMAEMERRGEAQIVELAIEEYFITHFQKKLEDKMSSKTSREKQS